MPVVPIEAGKDGVYRPGIEMAHGGAEGCPFGYAERRTAGGDRQNGDGLERRQREEPHLINTLRWGRRAFSDATFGLAS